MKFLLSVLVAILAFAAADTPLRIHIDNIERSHIINAVNSNPESTWVAGINQRFVGMTNDEIKRLLGSRAGGPVLQDVKLPKNFEAPTSFDGRTAWPECPSFKEIRDQSACGSCWAFGAVEAFTDRWCVASKGKQQPHFSATDMLACCYSCGMGCEGGYPSAAWSWAASTGIVTGGNYNNFTAGCWSYPFQNCEHHTTGERPPCSSLSYDTPDCTKKCDDKTSYPIPYSQDKHFFNTPYSVRGEQAMMAEISTHGSIEVSFTVYEDFVNYKSGIYKHTTGSVLGGHAVKAIGYGEEKGVKYWIIANSWGDDWAEQGFFRIIRGTNDCGIEAGGVAGLPKL